ncbi:MFS transporter [Actinomycetospora termitidis]|uniref:MFS transporter n=1 Tax=Actinomycetospora termitidis TaxID=3053470 RepID=A0ABT7ML17_9PSEU|nr:MFS transporter [Actinomycetospora sp. Odt1-22]MDL5160048.1 MFS transporter [Actinomycetospora sp. Odt1-22]
MRAREGAQAYREVLAQPGLRGLYAIGFAARVPLSATGTVLTLHVAVGLDRGFAAAGLVGGAVTLGTALGAPWLGRLIDRVGLRPVLLLCGLSEVVFWSLAPFLGVTVLVVTAFVAGALALPAFSVVRQSLGAVVPEVRRRPAFALDAMSSEVSFIAGPALGTGAVLALPSTVALWLVGVGFVLATAGLWWLNPPTRHDGRPPGREAPSMRHWLGAPMVVALLGAVAAVLLLSATELAVVAALTARGETGWFALANTVWCLTSLVGGFLYGIAARPPALPTLLAALAVGTIPVAFGGPWWLVTVLVVPAGAFCAPALSSAAEAVGRLAPDGARGVATGLHGSAIMLGAALAQPLTGLLIDRVSPTAALLAAVGICLLVAAGAAVGLRSDRQIASP